jgi:hypothetical protein
MGVPKDLDAALLGNAIQELCRGLSSHHDLEFVNAYIDTSRLGSKNADKLSQIGMSLIHSPVAKEAADKAIIVDLLLWLLIWERRQGRRQDATEPCVVLISQDHDFLPLLSKLRNQRGIHVVLVTEFRNARPQFLNAANEAFDWRDVVAEAQRMQEASGSDQAPRRIASGGASRGELAGDAAAGAAQQPSPSTTTAQVPRTLDAPTRRSSPPGQPATFDAAAPDRSPPPSPSQRRGAGHKSSGPPSPKSESSPQSSTDTQHGALARMTQHALKPAPHAAKGLEQQGAATAQLSRTAEEVYKARPPANMQTPPGSPTHKQTKSAPVPASASVLVPVSAPASVTAPASASVPASASAPARPVAAASAPVLRSQTPPPQRPATSLPAPKSLTPPPSPSGGKAAARALRVSTADEAQASPQASPRPSPPPSLPSSPKPNPLPSPLSSPLPSPLPSPVSPSGNRGRRRARKSEGGATEAIAAPVPLDTGASTCAVVMPRKPPTPLSTSTPPAVKAASEHSRAHVLRGRFSSVVIAPSRLEDQIADFTLCILLTKAKVTFDHLLSAMLNPAVGGGAQMLNFAAQDGGDRLRTIIESYPDRFSLSRCTRSKKLLVELAPGAHAFLTQEYMDAQLGLVSPPSSDEPQPGTPPARSQRSSSRWDIVLGD